MLFSNKIGQNRVIFEAQSNYFLGGIFNFIDPFMHIWGWNDPKTWKNKFWFLGFQHPLLLSQSTVEGCGKKAFYCVQKRRRKDSCEAAKALHVLLAQAMHFCVWKCWSTTREPCSSSRTDYDGFSQKSLKTFFFTLLGVADFYVTTRYPASHYIKFFKSPPFNRSHFLKSSLGTL